MSICLPLYDRRVIKEAIRADQLSILPLFLHVPIAVIFLWAKKDLHIERQPHESLEPLTTSYGSHPKSGKLHLSVRLKDKMVQPAN